MFTFFEVLVIMFSLFQLGLILAPIPISYDDSLKQLGVNGRNTPYWIKMAPGLDNLAGVLAQELFELKVKRIIPIGLALRFSRYLTRSMEIFSHEVEIQAGYILGPVRDRMAYRREEARQMKAGYPELFGDMDEDQIYDAMVLRASKARKWVKIHKRTLMKLMDKLYHSQEE